MKRQATEWEKIFTAHNQQWDHVEYIKDSYKSVKKKMDN